MQKLVALFFFIAYSLGQLNPNCAVIVPPNPLTAVGLATPYQFTAAVAGAGPCNQANPGQSSFVQGAVLDLTTGLAYVYNPLVSDVGTAPLVAPVVPVLPPNFIVGLWFGTNAGTLTLMDNAGSLKQGACTNGASANDIFGQFSYCNAVAFFAAANNLIANGLLTVPPKGTGYDGLACLTVRDFAVVDMDQSDNVVTTYIAVGAAIAQATQTNLASFSAGSTILFNGSDNRLLAIALDGALGCKPWMVPDLANPGYSLPALPYNELLAAADQITTPALVPVFDPMTLTNGLPNLVKLNLYRQGVNQPNATSLNDVTANTTLYCKNLIAIAPARIFKDKEFTSIRPSPDGGVLANNLYAFLASRLQTTLSAGGLNCVGLLKIVNPVTLIPPTGVATDATFNFAAITQIAPTVLATTIPVTTQNVIPPVTQPVASASKQNVVGSATSVSFSMFVVFLALAAALF
jgi:hypothetical protein